MLTPIWSNLIITHKCINIQKHIYTFQRRAKSLDVNFFKYSFCFIVNGLKFCMGKNINIRESLPADRDELERLYPAAFPEEALAPLVRNLLNEENGVISLVALKDEKLVGHVVFTICDIAEQKAKVGLLGPVAVTPDIQKQGIGSMLIQEGFKKLQSKGIQRVCVLGDPAYYGRFGFKSDMSILPPYELPEEWQMGWQFVSLDENSSAPKGNLSVPEPWREPSLWLP